MWREAVMFLSAEFSSYVASYFAILLTLLYSLVVFRNLFTPFPDVCFYHHYKEENRWYLQRHPKSVSLSITCFWIAIALIMGLTQHCSGIFPALLLYNACQKASAGAGPKTFIMKGIFSAPGRYGKSITDIWRKRDGVDVDKESSVSSRQVSF